MRLQRQRKKTKVRRKAVYRTVSLLTLSTVGLAQLTTSTYAIFTDQEMNTSTFKAAFVFPRTVKDICDRAGSGRGETGRHHDQIKRWLQECADDKVGSKAAYQLAQSAAAEAQAAQAGANSALTALAELSGIAARAQTEVNVSKQALDTLNEQFIKLPTASLRQQTSELEKKLKDAERVNGYVQPAYMQAKASADESAALASAAAAAAQSISSAAVAKEAKEEQAAEEKAKKEAADKAKKEADDKAKQEAADKAKQEAANKAKKDAEDKAKHDAEAKAKQEAADKAKQEAADKAKQGTDNKDGVVDGSQKVDQ